MVIDNSDMFTTIHNSFDCNETDLDPFKFLGDVARDYKVIYVCGSTSIIKSNTIV